MKKAPKISDEEQRLEKLYSYNVLDTAASDDFDHITSLAAHICGCKIALVSLIDSDRQWFKSKFGLEANETPRDISYCGHAIEGEDLFIVEDAEKDQRFCDNPLFLNPPHVRFYAGAPLITPEGYKVGTLCVIDSEPKILSDYQKKSLEKLSKIVIEILEKNYENAKLDHLRNQYEDVQSMASTGGWELDLITNKTYWSREIYNIHGLPFGESPEKIDAISFFAPHEREKLGLLIEECATKGIGYDEEFEFYDKQGNKKWVRSIGKPVYEKDGSIKKLIGTFQDITNQKESQRSLLEKNSEIEAYARGLNKYAIVARTNEKGKITYANDLFCEISGYSREELIGQDHRLLNSGHHSKEFFNKMWERIKSGQEWRGEIKNRAKDGSYYWVDTTIAPSFDSSGQIKEFIAFRYDITDRKLVEKARINELKSILSSTPSCLKIISKEGRLLNMNPQGLNLIEADDFPSVEGANVYEIVEESHREKYIKFNERICSGYSGSLIFEIVGLRGTRRWMETFAAPYKIDGGEVAHIAITNDISERIKAKHEFDKLLEDYKYKLKVEQDILGLNEEILNSTDDGILLVDHKARRIEKYNRRFLDLWRIPDELAASKDDEKLIGFVLEQLESPEAFVSLVEDLYQRPKDESFDVLDFVDGRVFERYSTPLIINDEVQGRIWFFRDITEKREMERMVNQTSKLAAIGQLAAGVGHEINNPLAIIKGYIETIINKGEGFSPEVEEKLLKINSASDRIAKIVLGLRTFARIETSSKIEVFNLKGMILGVENMLKELYLKDGVEINVDTENLGNEVCIQGDRGKFEQVLVNLISNAKDAIKESALKEVSIRCQKLENGKAEVIVSDSGKGIPYVDREKIFDPFFTTKDVGQGTGIGLSISHKFIHNDFDGSIKLGESKEGEGARFIINVPTVVSSEKNVQSIERKNNSREQFNLRVVLADDEEGIRVLLQSLLEDMGIEVVAFENGQLALEEYKRNSEFYDLIISDMKMPIMDGMTFLKEVRAKKSLKQPKFFFTTGGINIDFEDKKSELNEMIDGYIYKPFSQKELLSQLELAFPEIKKKSA